MSKLLVVMRLADMHQGHPAQDDTRFCSICSERVGVYPSGQKMLKHNPDMKIVCHVCIEAVHDPAALSVPAAPFEEILEEARQSTPVNGEVDVRASYHDDRFAERKCDHCGRAYQGPAVYCSFECAIDDL